MESSAATTMLLVRHGHVPGISPERFRGRTDIYLDASTGGSAESGLITPKRAGMWA